MMSFIQCTYTEVCVLVFFQWEPSTKTPDKNRNTLATMQRARTGICLRVQFSHKANTRSANNSTALVTAGHAASVQPYIHTLITSWHLSAVVLIPNLLSNLSTAFREWTFQSNYFIFHKETAYKCTLITNSINNVFIWKCSICFNPVIKFWFRFWFIF